MALHGGRLLTLLRGVAGSTGRGRFASSFAAGLKKNRYARVTLVSASGGLLVGAGYSAYTHYDVGRSRLAALVPPKDGLLAERPAYVPTKRVAGARHGDLEIVLFQYANCPFCSKVRTFLDSKGVRYEIVEVDALFKRALKWSEYKKVPTLVVKTPEGHRQLSDSAVIVSTLASYMMTDGRDLDEVARMYPETRIVHEDGKVKSEALNKYFLMYGRAVSPGREEALLRERKWRKWADEEFVHYISPNVYRNMTEARETFEWYADAGDWRRLFNPLEVELMINVGAVAMYAIGKRLKSKHRLKEDARESLYDQCRVWTKALKERDAPFMGGAEPDLSDLAVYGVLSSVQGTSAFKDVIQNTNIKNWYQQVQQFVDKNKGTVETLPTQ